MDERLDEVVQEIIDEQSLERVSAVKVFRSMLNQPNLVAISSADGIQEGANNTPLSQASYHTFTCNLPRPCLDVDSIQLVASNIPQANSNIPNTACTFWYYKLSQYSGSTPNINNLYYCRLLPSFYKEELVSDATSYGWNRTFKNYRDLETELTKIGQADLCFSNWLEADGDLDPPPAIVPFIPGDVSLVFNTPPYNAWSGAITYFIDMNVTYNGNSYRSLQNGNLNHSPTEANSVWWGLRTPLPMNKFQLIGNNTFTTPTYVVWADDVTYAKNNTITYDGKSYKSLQNGNLNHLPDEESSIWWVRSFNDTIATWDINTNYQLGRYVTLDDTIYQATYPNASQSPSGVYTWLSTITYTQFQVVLNPLNSTQYTYVNQIPKVNRRPDLYPVDWILTEYSAVQIYPAGFICKYSGDYYVALQNTSGQQPDTNPLFWEEIVFWTEVPDNSDNCWNRYLVTGYQDPNVLLAQGEEFQYTWNEFNLYEIGERVKYGELTYEAVTQNVGTPPIEYWSPTKSYVLGDQVLLDQYYQCILQPNVNQQPDEFPNYWVAIRTEWKFTSSPLPSSGLGYLTSVYDFYTNLAQGNEFFTFPQQIGGQPFVANPKRLLNSILGFTWNGIFSWTIPPFPLDIYTSTTYTTSKPNVQLINRLRPIPYYQLTQNVGVGLGSVFDPVAVNTSTFTADAYACLVYSSIVSVYTTIAGASSLDTSRNTNLLAITPMNAGNLGVAFSNPYIDNPLNKIAGDIYSIYIELRDEFGEPYLLSNNAVVTMMLKVRYVEENKPRENI
jgi:hypothetical protein